MRSASYQRFVETDRPPLRRRAVAVLLVLGVEALLVVMLLRLAPDLVGLPSVRTTPATFRLLPEPRIAPSRSRTPAKTRHSGGSTHRSPAPPLAAAAHAASHAKADLPLDIVHLTHQEFAAADIVALPSHAAPEAGGAAADGAGTGGGSAGGAGAGPGGAQLYNADWYIRPPSNAELAPYLPAHIDASSWGKIVCRMVADHRVEDCRQYDESPAGSGISRGMREAAWQFRVLPPRVNGRPILGVWVLITIYF